MPIGWMVKRALFGASGGQSVLAAPLRPVRERQLCQAVEPVWHQSSARLFTPNVGAQTHSLTFEKIGNALRKSSRGPPGRSGERAARKEIQKVRPDVNFIYFHRKING
jgi:hypothetical protein